jgi:hypothetical protein
MINSGESYRNRNIAHGTREDLPRGMGLRSRRRDRECARDPCSPELEGPKKDH